VPISRLAEAIAFAGEEIVKLGLVYTIVGHVGDGNFHCLVSFDPADPAQYAKVKAFIDTLARKAIALSGTATGEHGIGLGKMQYMEEEHGEALGVMRAIKQALDPQNLFNPGKMLPPSNR
jgi:D-lactate dehydrogenase (cytochrome)